MLHLFGEPGVSSFWKNKSPKQMHAIDTLGNAWFEDKLRFFLISFCRLLESVSYFCSLSHYLNPSGDSWHTPML